MSSPGTSPRARRCVVLLSSTLSDATLARWRDLRGCVAAGLDAVLVLTEELGDAARGLGLGEVEVIGAEEIFLPGYGEKSRSGRIRPGNTDLVMMAFARRRPWYEHVWMVEYDVFFPGGAELLARLDAASEAELITGDGPASRARGPNWYWWGSLQPPAGLAEVPAEQQLHGLFCVSRYGARLFAALEAAYRAGWRGHHECAVPTIARLAGLPIESLDAVSRRAVGVPARSPRSFATKACAAAPGALVYHPVKTRARERELVAEIAALGVPA